jgi:hypothetical protein
LNSSNIFTGLLADNFHGFFLKVASFELEKIDSSDIDYAEKCIVSTLTIHSFDLEGVTKQFPTDVINTPKNA